MNNEPAGIMVDETPIPNPDPKKPKKPVMFILPALLVVALIAAVGYLTTQSQVARQFAKKELDAWIESREANAKKHGIYMDITYEDLAFKGSTAPTAALSGVGVHLAAFENMQEGIPSKDDALHIYADDIALAPTALDLSAFDVTLSSPITFRNGTDAFDSVTISVESPIAFSTKQRATEYGTELAIHYPMPSMMEVRTLDTADSAPRLMTMYFGQGSAITSAMILEAPRLGETALKIRDLRVVASDVDYLTVKNIESEWQKYPENEAEDASYSTGLIEGFAGVDAQQIGETEIAWDIQTKGPVPRPGEVIPPFGSGDLNIRELRINALGASMQVQGQFSSLEGEVLPVGNAEIRLTQPAKLRDFLSEQGISSADDEVLADKLLMAMTGKGINASDEILIPISREAKGSLMLGNIRIEEALGIILNTQMSTKTPTPMPSPSVLE